LGIVSMLVPEVPESAPRLERSSIELARRLERLVLPDGTGAEQAMHYHLHILELVLAWIAVADAVGERRPAELTRVMSNSAEALLGLQDVHEPALRYGDDDDAV